MSTNIDFQWSSPWGEDATQEESRPAAAAIPYHRHQEDHGFVVPALGVADLRQPPETPAAESFSDSPNTEERLVSAWSVLHQTREELECARSRKDWGEELCQLERRVLGSEVAVRAIRRAMLLGRVDVAPQGFSSPRLRSEGFRFDTSSLPSEADDPSVWVYGKKVEELKAAARQELVKFLGQLLEVVETMMMVEETSGSDRQRREARERMKRALEIVARFAARLGDDMLDA